MKHPAGTPAGLVLIALLMAGGAGTATASPGAHLETGLVHPEDVAQAQSRLERLRARFGRPPNILIFLVDDLGWGDPGVYGGGEAIGAPTPGIDRLAHEGLRLTSVYAQPTCSPTRAALMTGRLPVRSGVTRPPLFGEKGGLDGESTAAELLRRAGYRTALVGKWHLGEAESQQPQNSGYDEFYGILSSIAAYTAWRDAHLHPEVALNPERTRFFETAGYIQSLVRATRGAKLEEIKALTIPVVAELEQDFAGYTESFLRRAAADRKPFYLIHAFSKVHSDSYPSPQWKGRSPAQQPYKDAVMEVDSVVARLVRVLEETGQAANTLVFFTSDNGPQDDTHPDSGFTPFRGRKGSTWEGGVRVPGIAWWPGTIRAGRVSDGLFDLMDLFNTALALGNATSSIPRDRYIDGIDQSSFLLSDEGRSNRDTVYHWMQDRFMALRWQEYKTHYQVLLPGDANAERYGGLQNTMVATTGYLGWVYNLYTDPGEQHPLGLRDEWILPFVQARKQRHLQSLRDYPPKAQSSSPW